MAEKPENPRPITLTLSDVHIRQMIKNHDLKEADAQDLIKVAGWPGVEEVKRVKRSPYSHGRCRMLTMQIAGH